MSLPKVTIIILNWNGLADTIECLESLMNIEYSNYDIILVDNGSNGRDVELLRSKFKGYIDIIQNDINYGFAEGNNIAIRYLLQRETDYVFLLNNDTVLNNSKLLLKLVKVGENDPRIGIIGPKVALYSDPNIIQSGFDGIKIGFDPLGKKLKTRYNITTHQKGDDTPRDILFVLGAAMLIKMKVFDKIGFLDPIYFCYQEEVDFCLRAWQSGFKVIYSPNVDILHKGGASTLANSGFKIYYQNRNTIIMMHKFLGKIEFTIFICWRLLITLPLSVLLFIKDRNWIRVKELLHGSIDALILLLTNKRILGI